MRYETPHRNRVGQDMRPHTAKCSICGWSFLNQLGLKIHQANNQTCISMAWTKHLETLGDKS